MMLAIHPEGCTGNYTSRGMYREWCRLFILRDVQGMVLAIHPH